MTNIPKKHRAALLGLGKHWHRCSVCGESRLCPNRVDYLQCSLLDACDLHDGSVSSVQLSGSTLTEGAAIPLQAESLDVWERRITHRVIVDGDIDLGELCTLLRDMWADAQTLERGSR
jgi:hypothetical protein